MGGNLNLEMRLTANGSQLSSALNSAGANVNAFANKANAASRSMVGGFKKLYAQLNGFSAISKIAIAAGGYSIVSDAIRRNLEFEKTLLEMKQLANMTQAQAAEMRASAITQASDLLATPQEVAEGMKVLANAGMKFESIAGTITEAGRAALLFRSSISDVANMDFDIQTKFKIDPSEMKRAHEILYSHSKDGRFEAKSLSQYAPVYLNEFKNVGIGGMGGLNFAGAITQAIQQAAPATQPGEVATMIKQGLSHIYSDGIGKKLKKETGIDIKKYASKDGKFYGKDGVEGLMDLALAMSAAGLDNQFKLQKAGFREQESRMFWLQLMNNAKDMKGKMKNAEGEAATNLGDRDVREIKGSNYAQFKKMEITQAKGQASDGATNAVGKAAAVAGWAAENPGTAFAAGAAAIVAGGILKKKLMGGGNVLEKAIGLSGKAGMPVMVTNWPAGMLGVPKASERMRELAEKAAGTVGGTGAGAAIASGAVATVAAGAVAVAAPLAVAYAFKQWQGSASGKEANARRWKMEIEGLDRRVNTAKSGGDKDAVTKLETQRAQQQAQLDQVVTELKAIAARPIEVHVDGRAIATAVNEVNGRDSRRQ